MGCVIAAIIVVGAVAMFIVMFIVLPAAMLRMMAPGLERRISAAHTPEAIVLRNLGALSFGLESRGVLQARGNGALVLTADELHWFQVVPERELRIARASITRVETVRAHLGKSMGRKLLRVSFTRDGKADAMAWYVTDLDGWLEQLEPARRASA